MADQTLHVELALLSDPGRKRPNNEDYVAFFEPADLREREVSGCLYIVADGVGGASKGEKASQYAAQRVLFEYYQNQHLSPEERLEEAMLQANRDIYQYSETAGEHQRMGTTLVAAVVRKSTLVVANVGDSRAYLIRDNQIWQISRDHSLVDELVRSGSMTKEEARTSRMKNRLTRSLGGEEEVSVDVFPEIQLIPGDRILLCTDGLTRYASDEDLLVLVSNGLVEDDVQKAVGFANNSGGADNISLVLISIGTANGRVIADRGQVPTRVDFELIDTVAPSNFRKRSHRRRKSIIELPERTSTRVMLAASVFLLVIAIAFTAWTVAKAFIPALVPAVLLKNGTPTPLVAATLVGLGRDASTIPGDGLPAADNLGNQTQGLGHSNMPTFTPMVTDEADQAPLEQTPLPTVEQTQDGAGGSTDESVCIYFTKTGDTLFEIYKNNNLPIPENTKFYYYYNGCSPEKDENCKRQKQENIDIVDPGNWVVLEGVSSEDCRSFGKWVSLKLIKE